jgi:CBS domain-containing protein
MAVIDSRRFRMNRTTDDIRVGDLMTADPVVIESDALATDAEQLLKTHRVTGLPVVEGGVTVGVISRTDLMVARSSRLIGGNWQRMRVRHLMSAPAITVHTGTSPARAAELMVTRHIHRVVVVDDEDAPIGVLSALDLLRLLPGAERWLQPSD